jgi:hypothetical protein
LLQLQEGPLFTSLLKLSPDVFPNSGHMALQFLAFYLPWLRRWWCKVCMEPMCMHTIQHCTFTLRARARPFENLLVLALSS